MTAGADKINQMVGCFARKGLLTVVPGLTRNRWPFVIPVKAGIAGLVDARSRPAASDPGSSPG
jgi:hypothetical protein